MGTISVRLEGSGARCLTLHAETAASIPASANEVFAVVDDHARLSSHMSKPSWWMGGGSMQLSTDDGRGQRVGSHIRLAGRAFGLEVDLNEIVIQRDPPFRKTWETVGSPRLVVIGSYRMGFEITPDGDQATLRVFLDYVLPQKRFPLCAALARLYARWCTQRMVTDAVNYFANP